MARPGAPARGLLCAAQHAHGGPTSWGWRRCSWSSSAARGWRSCSTGPTRCRRRRFPTPTPGCSTHGSWRSFSQAATWALVFSTTNPSFVPFEMMACRCAVVDLASERVVGLLEDGVNCRLAEPTPEAVAATVLDLLWNKEQRAAIVETAYQQVKDMSWQHSARQIEAVLLRHTPVRTARGVSRRRAATTSTCWPGRSTNCWTRGTTIRPWSTPCAARSTARWRRRRMLVQHVQEVEQRLSAAAGRCARCTGAGGAAADHGQAAGQHAGLAAGQRTAEQACRWTRSRSASRFAPTARTCAASSCALRRGRPYTPDRSESRYTKATNTGSWSQASC